MYWISLTGYTQNRIQNFEPESVSSSASATKAPSPQNTDQGQTVIVTATDAPPQNKSSGPNKAGIAAGVVVGVVVLAAVIGGVLLFLRQKKRRAVEEEYRRQAAANSFIAGGKLHTSNSSMTDSRLDPEFMNRRASNGSIADNEDYSRRILKVSPRVSKGDIARSNLALGHQRIVLHTRQSRPFLPFAGVLDISGSTSTITSIPRHRSNLITLIPPPVMFRHHA